MVELEFKNVAFICAKVARSYTSIPKSYAEEAALEIRVRCHSARLFLAVDVLLEVLAALLLLRSVEPAIFISTLGSLWPISLLIYENSLK